MNSLAGSRVINANAESIDMHFLFEFDRRVAVGMRITPHPPHRSVRALPTHPAPTSDAFRQTLHGEKDE
jgi:hypothetical protein